MDQLKKTFAELRRKARELGSTRWSRKELAQVALLKGAHQETIVPLLRDCPVKSLGSGEVLLFAGDPCRAIYMVLSGRLRIEEPSAKAAATPIRAGDCIGELALLEKTVVAATISALEPTRLLVIDRNTAWTLIRTSHEIARNWLLLFAERSRVSGVIAGSAELKTSHGHHPTHDECTGLYNRNWLDAMLPRQIARSTASGAPLGLILTEIDGFTDYVARFGPGAGDQACRAVAEILGINFRPTDLITCYGTAQFAVVLPDTDTAGACLAGERLRQAINAAKAHGLDENGSSALTLSIGATQFKPSTNASTLLAAAQAALQLAKSSGGNRVGMR
jgi:diguanylate cyclase (GGDEF)-like protein